MRIKKQKTNSAIFTRIVTAAVLLFFVFGSTAAQQSVDELKGDIDEKQQKLEIRETLDEEIPRLMPKSPLPRFKKISLEELVCNYFFTIAYVCVT